MAHHHLQIRYVDIVRQPAVYLLQLERTHIDNVRWQNVHLSIASMACYNLI